MTMTDERLAELDAVMAKANFTRLAAEYIPPNDHVEDGWRIHDFPPNSQVALCLAEGIDEEHAAAIVALHNAYPDLRAHIEAQAATIARSRAEVERLNGRALVLEAHLTEAIERVEKGDLDDRMCCDGHMCGCQGSTNADQFLHFARAALTGAA